MHLVPFIQDGCLWIIPHSGAAHFMNIQSGRLFGIIGFDIGKAGTGKHLRHLLQVVLHHFLIVIIIIDIHFE